MEIWKTIPTNTNYQVSNYGNVRSLDRTVVYKDGRTKVCKGTNLIGRNRRGYYYVSIGRNNDVAIHRLVATMFIDNPNQYDCVNHKDGDKHNNRVDNLEWCNYTQNLVHAYDTGLNPRQKKVKQFNLDGTFVAEWKSASECERVLGFNHRKISKCCNGKSKTHRGYRWCFS